MIDLAARLIVCQSSYSAASTEGSVKYLARDGATDLELTYHLADDWLVRSDTMGWRSIAAECREHRRSNPPLDVRAVLYGTPLLEYIASGCAAAFADRPIPAEPDWNDPAYQAELDTIRRLHVDWMMTPRDDLRGLTPREAMMQRIDFVDACVHDRECEWSVTDRQPRGIDPASTAYRFAGVGTHEFVLHYELVRELMWTCRLWLADRAAAGDSTDGVIERLSEHREWWLDEPDPECHGRTPRGMIANERARLPEGMSPAEAIVDHDCPLCQMQAEMSGPVFFSLDGCNMDEDFAFCFRHHTPEQWEAEQREHEEWSRRFDLEQAERERLGVSSEQVWQSSFAAEPMAGEPIIMRLFGIGFNLAELVANARDDPSDGARGEAQADRLSGAFANLREIAMRSEAEAFEALASPVLDAFIRTLDDVAAARPDLARKCDDLSRRVGRFLDSPGDGEADAFDDEDRIPF